MVERIRNDGVALIQQGLEQAAVGIETGGVEDRVLGSQELAQALFELLVNTLCSTDEANGSHAITVAIDGTVGRFTHGRMIGQAEIIVRTQVQDVAITRSDQAPLRAHEDTLTLVQALFLQTREIGSQPFNESWIHGFNYTLQA